MIFLNSASSAAALVFYLPGVCTHTDTKEKQRKTRVRNILKSLGKNTIFNEHPVSECLLKGELIETEPISLTNDISNQRMTALDDAVFGPIYFSSDDAHNS